MKYFIIAGEASGDLHGSNLIRELTIIDSSPEVVCWGGDLMEREGARVLKHYRDLAVMGVWEVIKNIGTILRNFRECKDQLIGFKPDVVILIDYPGFNLRIAGYLKGRIDNVYYYISPKVWAWKRSRIKKIKEFISRMYVIFPFEVEFYARQNLDVKYYGNPSVDTVREEVAKAPDREKFIVENRLEDKPTIALLAGSRVQEIKKILPMMINVTGYYIDYQFVVAGVESVPKEVYNTIIGSSGVKMVYNQTYSLFKHCDAAIVTSGTATLEAAIANVPQVVCYRTSWLTYILARRFLNIRFISLVNIIMDREIVKELVQGDMSARNIVSELNSILPGGWKRDVMKSEYSKLADSLSGSGAAQRVAEDIYNSLMLVNNVN